MRSAGVGVSTMNVTAAELALLPAASRAVATSVCEPVRSALGCTTNVYGAVTSIAAWRPSIAIATDTTPTLSAALTLTVNCALTCVPAAGAAIDTAGGVGFGGGGGAVHTR